MISFLYCLRSFFIKLATGLAIAWSLSVLSFFSLILLNVFVLFFIFTDDPFPPQPLPFLTGMSLWLTVTTPYYMVIGIIIAHILSAILEILDNDSDNRGDDDEDNNGPNSPAPSDRARVFFLLRPA